MAFEMVINNPKGGEFLRRIEWNKEAFTKQVKAIADRYSGELQISTPDEKKKAKEDRAFLNGIKKEIDARRKEVKAAIMEPYDIFEAEVKEGTAQLDAAAAAIDEQIKAYETREKEEKIKQIREYWEKHESRPASRGPLQAMTSWERIKSPEWVKTSYTIKKACADIDAAFQTAISNLQSIESIDDDRVIKNIMIDKLVETGSLAAAYETQARIHQQERARKEAEEQAERARKEREEKQAQARREAEDAERREKTQKAAAAGLEALRARLAAQEPPKQHGGINSAGATENESTAAQSVEEMPAAGDVRERGPVGNPTDTSTARNDAQNSAGQDPGRAQTEKIYKAKFWVAGTKEQLRDLGEYIKDMGLAGYGTIK